ncbi:MAG: AraC family transcriptional regulator [Clostridia bacterium]|nr:AraC family transcriptional regulator [Clostridia bacterium]
MLYSVNYENRHADLGVITFGNQACAPGHYYGYAIRENNLMHYIHSGRGVFICSGRSFRLCAGQAFLIHPGIPTYYQADEAEPWEYSWVSFCGGMADSLISNAGFSFDEPVIDASRRGYGNRLFRAMDAYSRAGSDNTGIVGLLMCFFFEAAQAGVDSKTHQKAGYVDRIMQYVTAEYSHRISVSEIAASLNLDRSYMSDMFRRRTGVCLQDYIINFRLDKARNLLEETDLSIKDIAFSVGYQDQLGFSKIFRSRSGLSPTAFRAACKSAQSAALPQ